VEQSVGRHHKGRILAGGDIGGREIQAKVDGIADQRRAGDSLNRPQRAAGAIVNESGHGAGERALLRSEHGARSQDETEYPEESSGHVVPNAVGPPIRRLP
jgi:hypothetical protein